MRIEAIELRRIRLPYRAPFETSGWREEANHSVIVTLHSEGVVGWGEAPVGVGPWYNEETQSTAWVMMREILAPMLLGRDLSRPEEVDAIFTRVRGNRMARAGLEFAAWDLFGRAQGTSLSTMLGGTRQRVEVGVSVGVQESIEALLDVVAGYVNAGYQRVKLKIKPGWDVEPTRAVRERWPDLRLQVDANSIYTLDQADQLARLDEFDLLLIEQPLAHDDIIDHAKLQRLLRTPICLDESIVSPDHARWAIELGACGVINIKPSRVGGFTAARRIHDLAQAVGRAANVGLASLPNFSLPGDISANDRYFHQDIVTNPFTLNPDSTLSVPTGPGSGAEVDLERLAAVTTDYVMLRA